MLSRTPAFLLAALCWSATALAGSSNSLLDVSPDGARLLVVNSDNDSVSVVDMRSRKVLHEIKVGDKPEGVTWIGNGPLAAVTVYREDRVVFLDTDDGQHRRETAASPTNPTASSPPRTAAGPRSRTSIPAPSARSTWSKRKVLRKIKAGSMVRGLALSSRRETPVRHRVLHRHPARRRSRAPARSSIPGRATPPITFARHVVVHPRRPKAYLSHIRSQDRGHRRRRLHLPASDHLRSWCRPTARAGARRWPWTPTTASMSSTNPWEAALSPDGKRLYTDLRRHQRHERLGR